LTGQTALAAAVHAQWSGEAALRGVRRPRPLRLRWSATRREVSAHPADVLNDDTLRGRQVNLRVSGDIFDIVGAFRRSPASKWWCWVSQARAGASWRCCSPLV
jgi:hypothetical protein